MSFTIAYHRFFSVRVKEHSTNNAIRSLSFNPTPDTIDHFKDHQLVFRSGDNGFDVYYRSNPDARTTLLSPIESITRFSFGIKVKDPSIFTLFEPANALYPNLYLDNLTPAGNISNSAQGNLTESTSVKQEDLSRIFPVTFIQKTNMDVADPPTQWRIKKKFTPQSTLQTVPFSNPDGSAILHIKLNDPVLHKAEYIAEEGPYVLETDKAAPPASTIYLSSYLSQRSVQGVLDIYWDSPQTNAPANSGREYQIIFKRK
jgi:hypothetical protein